MALKHETSITVFNDELLNINSTDHVILKLVQATMPNHV